mmetsp:Transcript_27773/g.83073  ORF Transcript_27773/g.83073 Transcript_27773/m.83073 type:complete len:821 (+) Transcript_27773:1-2463(+)
MSTVSGLQVIEFIRDWSLTAADFGKLDCETVMFWRALVTHAQQVTKDADLVDTLTPAVPSFAVLVQKWGEFCSPETGPKESAPEQRLEVRFIAEQLLWIARDLDYADEAGRSKMTQAIRELLLTPSLPERIVASAIELLKVVCYAESDRLQLVTEVIADLRHPIAARATLESKAADRTRLLEATRIKLRLNECKVELDGKVRAQQFAEAGRIKEEIESLERDRQALDDATATSHAAPVGEPSNDPVIVVSCLLITKHLLLTTSDSLKRAELTGLMHTLIIPAVKSTDPDTRCGALACLGMCLVLAESPVLAQEHLPMFMMILSLDQDIIKKVALKAIFDAVLAFGVDAFRSQPTETEPEGNDAADPTAQVKSTSVVQMLLPYLHNEDEGVRTIAVQGFARLLLQNHVTCPSVFSQLVELYFNPMTKDDQQLQQCLAVFFPAYAFSASSHAAIIEAAFLPTLRKVSHASRSSPLHAVKDMVVAKFFVYHTSQHEGVGVAAGEDSIHGSLGTKMLNEMMSDPSGQETRVLSSVLDMLSLDHCSDLTVQNMTVLTEMLAKAVSNRTIKKKITEFLERLTEIGTDALSEEQLAEVHSAMAKHREERDADVATMEKDDEASPVATRRASTRPQRNAAVVSRAASADIEAEHSEGETGDVPTAASTKNLVLEDDSLLGESNDDLTSEEDSEYEIEEILDMRKVGRRNEYLVKWKGYGDNANTWEPTTNLPADEIKQFKAKRKAAEAISKKALQVKAAKSPAQAETAAAADAEDVLVAKHKEVQDLENDIDDLLASDTPVKTTRNRRSNQKAVLADVNADLDILLGD